MSVTFQTTSEEDIEAWIEETSEFLISNSQRKILMISLSVILHGLISLAGVLSNSVNVLVFIRLGLKDSMSVGLWALSFTDFAVSALQFAACVSYLVSYVSPHAQINPLALAAFFFGWSRSVAYYLSCWITTLIAIERWYCVVSPFRVKEVFTISRCVFSIIAVYIIHISVLIPIFVYAPFVWGLCPTGETDVNGTIFYEMKMNVILTYDFAKWETINNIFEGVVLSLISQALIIVCSFWMIYSLKESSRFRKHKNYNEKKDNSEIKDNLSTRERLLVKVVILLAIIQTLCNIPRFIVTAVHHILPGIQQGAYFNLTIVMWELSYIFGTVCCASNIFVYLKLNSSFRQHFYKMFLAHK